MPLKLSLTAPVSPAGFSGEQRTAPPLPTGGGVSSAAPTKARVQSARPCSARPPTCAAGGSIEPHGPGESVHGVRLPWVDRPSTLCGADAP